MSTPGVTRQDLLPGNPDRSRHAARAARLLEGREPDDIVAWSIDTFGHRLGFTTALGYAGIVLLDLLRRRLALVEAHFIDTRCHFDETIDLLRRLEAWGEATPGGRVRFITLQSHLSDEQIAERAGAPPWQSNPDLCCRLRKVEPLARVLPTRDAWLSALRRDQSGSRASIEPVQLDTRGTLKIHPLATWTAAQCWDHIHANNIPYNPLHDCGYPSIGCMHCTVPIHTGEHERAGRWAGTGKTECGIHTT